MTFTIKSETINGVYIAIEQEKFSKGYTVSAFPELEKGFVGYPITSIVYPDIEKAKARYRTLKRKAMKGEI